MTMYRRKNASIRIDKGSHNAEYLSATIRLASLKSSTGRDELRSFIKALNNTLSLATESAKEAK